MSIVRRHCGNGKWSGSALGGELQHFDYKLLNFVDGRPVFQISEYS